MGIPAITPVVRSLPEPTTRYVVAAWFPAGMGGSSFYETEAEAFQARERMILLGYEDVRILKKTVEWLS